MSKKIQSSVDWLISCITEDQMVKAKSLNEWLEIFEKAKAMHKDEIENAQSIAISNADMTKNRGYFDTEQYYNETFGGDNE